MSIKDRINLINESDFELISNALLEYAASLRNRFDDDKRYIHPAEKYELLFKKLYPKQ
jgi:hypothetical protein